jgi:hypothetical protein
VDNALGTVGTIAFAFSTTLQDARSGRSIRMRHTAMVILEMKYSTINPRLKILNGRIKCFETAEEAIAHAKKNKCQAYEWGVVIYGQLELNFKLMFSAINQPPQRGKEEA